MTSKVPYLNARYAPYEEALNEPTMKALFDLAVKWRKEINVANTLEREAHVRRQIGQKWKATGLCVAYQRAWVDTTEALVLALGFQTGTEYSRDIFDLTSAVAAGNYSLTDTNAPMTDAELDAAFAVFS